MESSTHSQFAIKMHSFIAAHLPKATQYVNVVFLFNLFRSNCFFGNIVKLVINKIWLVTGKLTNSTKAQELLQHASNFLAVDLFCCGIM